MKPKPKIIVILGQTATGKSDLAVQLAKKLNGEIISADSRQVYTGLDLGTGKVTKKEMGNVPHHLLDIISAKKQFNVVDFQNLAYKKIEDISKRNKLPIICGGTGLYIKSVVDNINFPKIKPNKKLREKLEKKNYEELFKILKKLSLEKSRNIDPKNKRRLIRTIEISKMQIHTDKTQIDADNYDYDFLQIGIKADDKTLRKRIHDRLLKRIKIGMINEAKNLHKKGVTWKRMEELGLEYRYLSRHLRGLLTKKEMIEQLETKIWQFSRRQKTWFKKQPNIKWFNLTDYPKIEKEVKRFLK